MRLGDLMAKPTKLGELIADEKPPFRFGGGKSRGAGGGGYIDDFPPPPKNVPFSGPQEPGLEERFDISPLTLMPGMRAAVGAGPLAQRLIAPAITGGTAVGGFGLAEDAIQGRNPLPNLPGNVAAGAAFGPAFGLAARGVAGAARRIVPRPTVAAPAAAPAPRTPAAATAVLEPPVAAAPAAPPAPPAAPRLEPPAVMPERQPFTGKTQQQQAPSVSDIASEIRNDPDYLRRLNELGGGRVQTNKETVAAALQAGPMEPAVIKNWKAETPVNAVEQTRALITNDWYQRRFLAAMAAGDERVADEALAVWKEMEPGITNIRATGGRATQAQAMFVEDEVAKAYREIADLRKKGVPFEQLRERANEALMSVENTKHLTSMRKTAEKWVRALETYATAAKLTSPVTHAINTTSNALTFFTVRAGQKAGAAVAHLVEGRPAEAAGQLYALFGTTSGFSSGARKYLSTLMDDATIKGKFAEASPSALKMPRALRPLDPFRQLAAADAFWKAVIRDSELHGRALASAMKQGLSGEARAKRVAELLSDPPEPWVAKADEVAKEFTFQADPGTILQGVARMRDLPGGRFLVPFIQTPFNLAVFQLQRSPLGALSPRNIKDFSASGADRAQAIGRMMVGGAMAGAAWSVVSRGEVTGAFPQNARERELWVAEGRKPYSVRVGDKWVAYNRFQPLGFYLSQAASLKEAMDAGNQKGAEALIGKLTLDGARAVFDMPFVAGMSSLMDALQDPQRSGAKFISQTATGLVPNILRDVRYQTDPFVRESKGVKASVMNMVPGLSERLPKRYDIEGRPVRYDENRGLRSTKVVAGSTDSEITKALREAGYSEGDAGTKPKLSPADNAEMEREIGEEKSRVWRNIIASDSYSRLSKEARLDRLNDASRNVTRRVRARWKRKSTTAQRGTEAK